MNNEHLLTLIHATRQSGSPLLVAGVGSGLTAKGAAAGGADLLAVYSTAVYRIRGLPTALAFLPYDDANALALEAAPEVIAAAGRVPVLLGFGAHDPRRSISQLIDRAEELGAVGVTNEPFLGIYGHDIAVQLEAAGLGFSREVELLRLAARRGQLTLGWAFTPEEAVKLAEAGVAMIGAMVGVTAGGPAGGATVIALDEAIRAIEAIVRAARRVKEDIVVLGHGGPFNDPPSVSMLLSRVAVDGYVTGSTGERIPVEKGVAEAIRSFKSVRPVVGSRDADATGTRRH